MIVKLDMGKFLDQLRLSTSEEHYHETWHAHLIRFMEIANEVGMKRGAQTPISFSPIIGDINKQVNQLITDIEDDPLFPDYDPIRKDCFIALIAHNDPEVYKNYIELEHCRLN